MTAPFPLRHRALAACALMLALSACAPPPSTIAPDPTLASTDTPASAAVRKHYAKVQSALLTEGLLRTDGGNGPATLAAMEKVGCGVDACALELQQEGAASFVKSWNEMLAKIQSKSAAMAK